MCCNQCGHATYHHESCLRRVLVERVVCRHCQVKPISRARRLCSRCYMTPAIRKQYPRLDRFRSSDIPDRTGEQPEPAPCDAAPGTEAKLAELCRRAERGESLFRADERPRGPAARRSEYGRLARVLVSARGLPVEE